MKKKWIQELNLDEGAFTRKAKAAGMSVARYAQHVLEEGSRASTKTKRQANLARTFQKISKKR